MTEVKVKSPDKGPMPWYHQLWAIKDTIIIIATPLILLPLVFMPFVKEDVKAEKTEKIGTNIEPERAARCAYTILIMAIYWMTEALPMAVTALLPIVLFPWLGVLDSKKVCENYLKDANMLFFGGLLVAVAVEKWNLHKRVALRVLLLVGSKPLWIMFGFMAVTGFLSMWLNNTATTAMMMPIAQAVLTELDINRKQQLEMKENVVGKSKGSHEHIPLQERRSSKGSRKLEDVVVDVNGSQSASASIKPSEDDKSKEIAELEGETDPLQMKESVLSVERKRSDLLFMNFRKALKLSIPFASSIGGTGTLIGCGPNIVLKGQLESIYTGGDTGINFTSWLVIGFPAAIVDLVGAWLLLMIVFFGPKETFKREKRTADTDDSANQIIRAEYEKLGKITFAEVVVLVNFVVLALLWLTRQPGFMTGWGDLKLWNGVVTDACVAITISVLLFVFPSQMPNYLCFRRKTDATTPGPAKPILDWPTVNKQMPWSVIVLLGGGFALADGCKLSTLSAAIGVALSGFRDLQPWILVMMMCILATIITSITSNMATTTIFIPILAEIAAKTCINPIYLMLPVTLAASWAFILPVSTPPNAIAHSYGDIAILDMIKSGIVMCVLCNAVLLFSINTWGYAYFNLGVLPKWANRPDMVCDEFINRNMSTPFNSTGAFEMTTIGNATLYL